jgi:hypothetical protein
VRSEFLVRERQTTKLRLEISSVNVDGSPRKLAALFKLIESSKHALKIQEYSISQTSLEQVKMNSFDSDIVPFSHTFFLPFFCRYE